MRGLSTIESRERLRRDGPNTITQVKRSSRVKIFLEQFKSPLVVILIFAFLLALILGEYKESLAIGLILMVNALVGFIQEYRAETSIAALKKLTAPKAAVIRNGVKTLIPASDIVIGDLLTLEAGDIIAADAELISCSQLQVNEAILTGESLAVHKSMDDEKQKFVFMGTSVVNGVGEAIVTKTGMKTELGKIAHLISSATMELTPMQKQLELLGKNLLYLCVIVITLVAVVGFFRGISGMDLLIFSISLAVAVVPEGLPAIVTIALALGVERLSAKGALVRKLPSVETLGSVSIICTDKTGTLTTGQMTVRELFAYIENEEFLIKAASSCCDAELTENESFGDPTELAILMKAKQWDIDKKTIEATNERVSLLPFDSDRKRMSIFRRDGINYVKGAFESILSLCSLKEFEKQKLLEESNQMTQRGLRVLAVALGKTAEESNLQFVGMIGIADPPRPEAVEAIRVAKNAGIRPIMITGDHKLTATAIAKEMGLIEENESPEGKVHSRATPEQKLQLVRHWKEKGHIVAMTGDGVNDAPALREAHIGIAMGKQGTEVTRQAADLILTDDNFATIVSAVLEGRGIYQNIRKSIVYLLSGNFSELSLVVLALIAGLPLPLLASHLLWINLVTDAMPAMALIVDPLESDLLKQKPRSIQEKMIGKKEWIRIAMIGLTESLCVFVLYASLLKNNTAESARGIAFTTLVISQILRALSARSKVQTFFKKGAFQNRWLMGTIGGTFLLQFSLHYFSITQDIFNLHILTLKEFQLIILVAIIPVSLIEITKWRKLK